jgi:hypothetical protein
VISYLGPLGPFFLSQLRNAWISQKSEVNLPGRTFKFQSQFPLSSTPH